MNIHLSLWLIYLINISSDLKFVLVIIGIILIGWFITIGLNYLIKGDALATLIKNNEDKEIVAYDGKKGKCEDFCNELENSRRILRKIAILLSYAIVLLLLLWVAIPSKENAIQLVKINYINQSNILLDANSIEALSQNIDSVLKK